MKTIQHKFVEFIPEELEEGVIYITFAYRTAVHKCICGCGNKVVTPFSPTDWKLIFDGKTISLSPSIGNWNFDCRSHYFIRNNNIVYAGRWDEKRIDDGRKADKKNKRKYFAGKFLKRKKHKDEDR